MSELTSSTRDQAGTHLFFARQRHGTRTIKLSEQERTQLARERSVDMYRALGGTIALLNGREEWTTDGIRHRLDGPAVSSPTEQQWWVDGVRHRIDGPAVSSATDQQWWVNGQLHRTDGPAFTTDSGYQVWWYQGQRHRSDGPAAERPDGQVEWWLQGRHFKDEAAWRRVCDIWILAQNSRC